MPDALAATLTISPDRPARPEDLVARCALRNTAAQPVTIHPAALSSPSLAIEIVDANADPVLLPPPPVPAAQPVAATLAPGAQRETEFAGFVPSWTPPGRYRARFRYVAAGVSVHSGWVTFDLVA